jgi:hypothetical protein
MDPFNSRPGGFRANPKPHGNSTSILSAAHFEASMTWTLKSDHTCLKHGGELSGESEAHNSSDDTQHTCPAA